MASTRRRSAGSKCASRDGSLELSLAQTLSLLPQRRDGRDHAPAGQPGLEARDLIIDDYFDCADFAPPGLEVGSAAAWRSSMSNKCTPGTSRRPDSTSRGTAMSTMSEGVGLDFIAAAMSGALMMSRGRRGGRDHHVSFGQRRRQV
jgi:hypothetical protein